MLADEFKRDLNSVLQSPGPSAPIQSIEDVGAFITDYLAANPVADGPSKYGKVRVDTSIAMDLSPGSANTAQYLADRVLNILNSLRGRQMDRLRLRLGAGPCPAPFACAHARPAW